MPKIQDELSSRPPWERMMRIHHLLQQGKYPNCSRIAKEVEVSVRTIKRDVDFMKYRLQLPIEYDSRRYGYYYTAKVSHFPSTAATEADAFALLIAHKAVDQYRGTPFHKPLEIAFRKLTDQLDGQTRYSFGDLDQALSFRPFAPEDTDLESFEVLTKALQNNRVLTFAYKNLGTRNHRPRRVHPYHLAFIENHWYLFAFDLDRKAMRTFVVNRMKKPQATKKTFMKPKDFNPDEYLRGSFTVFKGTEDYEVVVDFDGWATDLLRGRKWHVSQDFHELPDGCSRLRMRLNSIEEMERWVLSWGGHATVVRPAALRARLDVVSVALHKRYGATESGE